MTARPGRAPGMGELVGLWRRCLLVGPDDSRDTETEVTWLQGDRAYVDLRRPVGTPGCFGVRGLRQLTISQLLALAEQEGFAGWLEPAGGFFEWRRVVDLQPPSKHPDAGSLRLQGQRRCDHGFLAPPAAVVPERDHRDHRHHMVEEGRDIPYVEHWRRGTDPVVPRASVHLRDPETGTDGFVVRVGATFMYARARSAELLPVGTRLRDAVRGATSLRVAQDLLDCEVSLGRVDSRAWTVERSSLPFKVGTPLAPEFLPGAGDRYRTADLTADGTPTPRTWEIITAEGDLGALDATRAPVRRPAQEC
ncbi:MAG: hypothetical protein ACQSGP_21450 [Frankia sp.]